MLDIGWWELAVIGMVALIVVGPKELPAMLRTIGRYVGMAKRQADEFRSQFDEAIRESEFNDLRKEMNDIKSGVTSTLDDAQALRVQAHVGDHARRQQADRVAGRRVAEARVELLGHRGAADDGAPLVDRHVVSGPGQVERTDQAVVSAADDGEGFWFDQVSGKATAWLQSPFGAIRLNCCPFDGGVWILRAPAICA